MEEAGITIVVPAFRAARTLRRAVQSAPGEARVIVVFDGPDAAAESAIADLPVTRVRMNAGSGAPACRNAGLAQAVSPFVLFLDADDYFEGPLLQGACRVAQQAPADLVLAPFAFEYPDGSRQVCDLRLRYREASAETLLRAWLSELYTPPCAVVWRREFLQAIGGWDEGVAKNQDGDLIFRALACRPASPSPLAGSASMCRTTTPTASAGARIRARWRRKFASSTACAKCRRRRISRSSRSWRAPITAWRAGPIRTKPTRSARRRSRRRANWGSAARSVP
jgi:glycosyltransferase involved in cell wall biosynthesis